MPTNTAGTAARAYFDKQLVHYLKFDVNFNDANVANGVGKQTLPAGAIIVGTDVLITTAFNAATTNVLTVGTNGPSTYDNIATSAQTVSGTPGLKQNLAPTGTALGKIAADAQVFVKYTQSGTAATTGAGTVIVKYVIANDL